MKSVRGGGTEPTTDMDQASGGEDPSKPSKKKSGEDEGKNKKLVGVQTVWGGSEQLTRTSCAVPRAGVDVTLKVALLHTFTTLQWCCV